MQVKLTHKNGLLQIDIGGDLYLPLSFKSFRPNPQNVSEFYSAGVRLFSVLTSGLTSALGVPYSLYGESWIGEYEYDFSAIDRQMDMFIENAPDAYFAPMIQLDTRPWYLAAHPGVPNSFTCLSQIAGHAPWKEAAAAYLQAALRHCEEKYGDRIYGYFLLCGTTTEWFSDRDYEAPHPLKEEAYRRYTGDAHATLPAKERLDRTGPVFLTHGEEDIYRARVFHNESIADLILYFTGKAQEVLSHKKLLGLYYGYLFELGGERLYNAGSLGYEKVFENPDIDMISSPSAYGYRALSDPSAFMVTSRTLDAHGKLYFLEFDHITHVAPTVIREAHTDTTGNGGMVEIPGASSKCKNETEALNLMYRDFLLCQANGAALWWFDMFDGWFRSPGMMQAVSRMIGVAGQLAAQDMRSIAEIAVFAEGRSMYSVRKTSGIPTVCLSDIRRTLAECGAPYDLYSVGDLSLAAARDYRLYLFVNQYTIEEETRAVIEALKEEGKTVLFLYAPDYARENRTDLSRIASVTGMCVTESDVSHGPLLYRGRKVDYGLSAPYFSVTDPDALPLAHYADGHVAAARKGSVIYVTTPNLPAALLREIARDAGVFVYSEREEVYTYPNAGMLGVFCAGEETAEIRLPEDGTYRDLLVGGRFVSHEKKLSLPARDIRAYLLIKE